MGCLQGKIVTMNFLFIFCTVLVNADLMITVTNKTCGGRINLDSSTRLRLNYYGAEIGDPKKSEMLRQKDKTCLYNISSSSREEMEICVLLLLQETRSPWDITCTKSLNVYIGKYHNVYMPSRYVCADLKPLCTSERNVFLQFQFSRTLRFLNWNVSVELDVYLRNKIVTTTTLRPTTVTPLSIEENESSFLSTEITIVIAVVATFVTCCLCYICCCSKEEASPPPSQNVNDSSNNDCPENIRMLQAPVVQPPPENMSGAAGDPPDYYSVCPQGIATDKPANTMLCNFADLMSSLNELDHDLLLFHGHSGYEEDKVIPSAPPPTYPGL